MDGAMVADTNNQAIEWIRRWAFIVRCFFSTCDAGCPQKQPSQNSMLRGGNIARGVAKISLEQGF
jgi:hypothetical protein